MGTCLDHGTKGSATSWTTNSESPGSNRLQLLFVENTNNATGTAETPTVTGCGLTWVQVGTATGSRGGIGDRLTIFRAMGASPSTDALTIDFGGVGNLGNYSWLEFNDVDSSGSNGENAIVQFHFAGSADGAASVSMDAYDSEENPTVGGVATRFTHATNTAGAGFTQLSAEECQGNYCLETQWKATGSVASVTWGGSNGSNTNWYSAFGAELASVAPLEAEGHLVGVGVLTGAGDVSTEEGGETMFASGSIVGAGATAAGASVSRIAGALSKRAVPTTTQDA